MMNQYPFLEGKTGKFVFGTFLFVMLLLARDTLITSVLLGFNKSQFLMLGMVAVFGLSFLIQHRKSVKLVFTDKRVFLILLMTAMLLTPMLVKQDWQLMYFSILFCPAFAVFLTYFTSYKNVAKYYAVILCALGVHSLCTMYLFKDLAISGEIAAPMVTNSAGQEFFNFGLSFVVTSPYWNRNFGLFREPGVYQFFVLLGLYLNNYAVSWKRLWQLWLVNVLLVAMMVSTFAIGGFVETGLFAVFLYFDKKWYRNKWGRLFGAAAVAAVVCAILFVLAQMKKPDFAQTVFYEFYDMFLRLTTKSDSLVDRFSAIFTNVELFLQSPLAGNRVADVLHGTNHNTSSTLLLYAIFGFAGGTLNVAAWIALLWKRERNLFGNLMLMLILFMSFNTQNLVADVFFWLFPTMALAERGLPLLQLPKKEA